VEIQYSREQKAESAVFSKFCRRSKALDKNKFIFNLDFVIPGNDTVAIFFETSRWDKII
jgi:hypothetical protein